MDIYMSGKQPNRVQLKRNRRPLSFFRHPAEYVASRLLGDLLVRATPRGLMAGRIVETEAYPGGDDDASHTFAHKKTNRTRVLYEPGGRIYVYLIYGIYHCFNIVCAPRGNPQGVFIRAVEPVFGIEQMKKNRPVDTITKLTSGPCRWTQSFQVGLELCGERLDGRTCWVVRGPKRGIAVRRSPRVGVEYAVESKTRLLRFFIGGNQFVSKVSLRRTCG
ncbi:MAG: DNA-3-methyladenine glycosylase [Candidatus Omnitrophica bacterium]|nr:DNA-3-methyladenine glycosylase [Candidatus Omnitrophota bacterium]